MIEISRNEKCVNVKVTSHYPLSGAYEFEWNCGRNDFAALLAENLRTNMHNKIEKIRRDAYNQGWKDAKSKKVKKETWFSSIWQN